MIPRLPQNNFSGQPSNLGPEANGGDPLSSTQRSIRRGDVWTEPGRAVRERGRIVAVDANRRSYRVVTLGGRNITCLRIMDSPQDHALLPIGTDVRVDWSLGAPYIDGILPAEGDVPSAASNAVDNPTGTEGFVINDPVLDRNYGANARPIGAPTDILPGDFLQQGPDGASVGALGGQVAMLHGGHLAQLMLFGAQDRAELIAGVLRIITWMGESKTVNENGRTSFIWRGGANQLSETGADEENYTIQLDVGATGDLVNLRVTTVDQQTLFQAHITADGHIELFGIAGVNATYNDRLNTGHTIRYAGDIDKRVEGSVTDYVTGNQTNTVEGDFSEELSNNMAQRIGNDWNVRANRNIELNAGGGMSRQIVGDELKSVGGKSEETITGHKQSYADDYNEVKSTNGSVKLTCQNANMTFDAGSNTVVVTCDSMEVSGNSDNAVLYTPLQNLLNTFITNYSVHTHEVATSGTAVAQSGLAAPPIDSTSSLTGQLQQLQSQSLKLGS